MEFLAGSSLAPTEQSTPQEIRFWGAANHHILRRNQLPESYSAVRVEFDRHGDFAHNRVNLFNNFAVTDHHDDTHHYAFEIAQLQVPNGSPQSGKSFLHTADVGVIITEADVGSAANSSTPHLHTTPPRPPSASTSQLPLTQTISINNTTYPYYPLSATMNSRPLTGPILVKLGFDDELVDIDVSLRLKDRIIVRGHALLDHAAVQQHTTITQDEIDAIHDANPLPAITHGNDVQGNRAQSREVVIAQRQHALKKLAQKHSLRSALNSKTLAYGGEVTYNGPTYSLGAKYTSFDNVLGCHATKSFNISPSPTHHNHETGPNTSKSSPQRGLGRNRGLTTSPSQFTTNPTWFLPSSVDVGVEYHIKYDDLQDTFTLGAVTSWDEFHQGLDKPNIKQWRLKKVGYERSGANEVDFCDYIYPSFSSPLTQPHSTLSQSPSIKPVAIIDNGNVGHNNSGEEDDGYDVITTSTLPTSLQIDVNGIGTLAFGLTTSLYDEVKRVTAPPRNVGHGSNKNNNDANGNTKHTPTFHFHDTATPPRFGTPSNIVSVPLLGLGSNGAVEVGLGTNTPFIPLPTDHSSSPSHTAPDLSVLSQFIPEIVTDFASSLANLFVSSTAFPVNIITPLLQLKTPGLDDSYSHHNELISHSSLSMASKLEYSIGSRESGLHCGLQHINHTFQRQYTQHHPQNDEDHNTKIRKTIASPWTMTASAQNTIAVSTTKGLSYDYTLQFSPLPDLLAPPSFLDPTPHHNSDTAPLLSRQNNFQTSESLRHWFVSNYNSAIVRALPQFYFNLSLSTLFPFQISEHWFRTHHSFPLLPMPQQPYQELDATPCAQHQQSAGGLANNVNYAVQSWYPANHTHNGKDILYNNNNPHNHNNQISTTAPPYLLDQSSASIVSTAPSTMSLIPTTTTTTTTAAGAYHSAPHNPNATMNTTLNTTMTTSGSDTASSKATSVNSDTVTRRLSLCGQNGEWKSISTSGASPAPIWNPYEGLKVNIGFGFDV